MHQLDTSEASMPFPILIGDIGGTNARFADHRDRDAEQINFPNVRTADFETIDDAIRATILEKSASAALGDPRRRRPDQATMRSR
jgi:glucokinase